MVPIFFRSRSGFARLSVLNKDLAEFRNAFLCLHFVLCTSKTLLSDRLNLTNHIFDMKIFLWRFLMTTYNFYPKQFQVLTSDDGNYQILEAGTTNKVITFFKDTLPTETTPFAVKDLFQFIVHTVHSSNPTLPPEIYRNETIKALHSTKKSVTLSCKNVT